jgi:hypothetical protein
MAVEAITYVWQSTKQSGSGLVMMLALADYANQDGVCWPGIEALAEKCRMTERNAQLLLKRLAKDSEIIIHRNKGVATGTGNTNKYELIGFVEWLEEVKRISSLKKQGVKNRASRGEKSGSQGVKAASPKPSLEPSLEPLGVDALPPHVADAVDKAMHTPAYSDPLALMKGYPLIEAFINAFPENARNPAIKRQRSVQQMAAELAQVEPPYTPDEVTQVVTVKLKAGRTDYRFAYLGDDLQAARLTKPKHQVTPIMGNVVYDDRTNTTMIWDAREERWDYHKGRVTA